MDAVQPSQPYARQAIAAGATPWFDSSRTPLLITDGIATRPQVAEHRRPELVAFCRAWFRAAAWWRDHPEEAQALLMRRLATDAAVVASDGMRRFDLDDNRRLLAGGALRDIAGIYVAHAIHRGILARAPDPAALIDPSFLPPP